MAAEDFRKLSPEQVQKLSRTINDAKTLTNQQAEIIENVIAGEIDIGKLRISYLDEYLDTYSKGLDLIARKHSTLNDAFLILDQKINDGYRRVTTESAKAVNELSKAADEVARTRQTAKSVESITEDNQKNEQADSKATQASKSKTTSEPNNTRELLDVILKQNSAKAQTNENNLNHTSVSRKRATSTKSYNNEQQISTAKNTQESSVEQHLKDVTKKLKLNNTPELSTNSNNVGYSNELAARQSTVPSVASELATSSAEVLQLETEHQDKQFQQYTEHSDKIAEIITYITGLELSRYQLEKDEISLVTDMLLKKFRAISSETTHENTAPTVPSTPASNGNGGNGGGGSSGGGGPTKNNAYTVVSPEKRDEMDRAILDDSLKFIDKIFDALKEDTTDATRNAIMAKDAESNAAIQFAELKAYQLEKEAEQASELTAKKEQLINRLMNLELVRHEEESEYINRAADLKLARLQETTDAELKAQNAVNNSIVRRQLEATPEGVKLQESAIAAEDTQRSIQILDEQRLQYIAQQELELKRQNHKELTAEEKADIAKSANEKFKLDEANLNAITDLRARLGAEYFEKEKKYQNTLIALEKAKQQEDADVEARIQDAKLANELAVAEAELKAQNLLNSIQAEQAYVAANLQEVGELRASESNAAAGIKSAQELEEARVKYITKKELDAKRKNNGILTAEESAKIQRQAAEKFKLDQKNLEAITKRQTQLEAAKALATERADMRSTTNNLFAADSFVERKQAFYDLTHDETGNKDLGKTISATILAVSDLAKRLEVTIDEIAKNKSAIDTRLQGSSNKTSLGSYWDQITKDITSVGAINPYFRQEDFTKNIKTLVEKGIAFDIEQRAFLMTIQEKIANTFNVADGTLLRLIRIQQEDSTAGRLGMEASLNAFLNNMYETTEYLSDVAASVRSSLEEMESLMSGAEATEVEYQVQKWLGSLYSVGMSQSAVNSISQTLGQIASGQIDGLTGGGTGNLLVMAANNAGLPIADILTEGLDASNTNKLMESVVNYLAEIAESSKDNNVVQQQLASVFGVKASDLRAATNLTSKSSVSTISSSYMQYSNMLNELFTMAGSMGDRTSLAEKLTNIWENGKYSLAGGVASSPAAYFIYKAATLLDDTVGGIDLPFINIFGSGVDLNTSVSELMRVGSLGVGILGSIGPMLSGLANSFSGKKMLKQLGIAEGDTGLTTTPRGSYVSGNIGAAGGQVSESGYIGNASGSDVKNTTLQEADSTKRQLMVEAKEEEEANQVNVLNTTVLKIYELLDDVAHGNSYFRVKVEGYGLTRASSSSNTLGGVNALSGLSDSSAGATSSYNGTSGVGVNSSSVTGSVDFGGWTTVM